MSKLPYVYDPVLREQFEGDAQVLGVNLDVAERELVGLKRGENT